MDDRANFFFLLLIAFSLTACAQNVSVPPGDLIGESQHYEVKAEDTLFLIARRFNTGITELLAANPGTDIWLPEPGKTLLIPGQYILPEAPAQGIVINLAEMRLFYFPEQGPAQTFPIGIGRENWNTPTGKTKIIKKRVNPVWIPPPSIRANNPHLPTAVPPGPDNPLGSHALNLGWPSYVIHGTNQPYGVGRRSSHGCVRLYPEDIPILFAQVAVGTPITVVNQPYKLGWRGDRLYLEVSPTPAEADELLLEGKFLSAAKPTAALQQRLSQLQDQGVQLNWQTITQVIEARTGIPTTIGQRDDSYLVQQTRDKE